MVEKAYKGTISSVILSIVVVGILLVPFVVADRIQKTRSGEGKYDFKESLCWDIDELEDFNNEMDDVGEVCGSGALGYWYESPGVDLSLNPITFESYPIEGTMDGYGMGSTVSCNGGEIDFAMILIFLTITKDDITENDITRIDIFFDINELEDCSFEVWILTWYDEPGIKIGETVIGELSSFEIDVDDIMEFYTFSDEEIFLLFVPCEEEECIIQPDSTVVFDMQWYCIEEMKIPSLFWLGIAMTGGGIFMMFVSVLMLPSIDFGGLFKKDKGGE